jgi:branched-chain amino acid transport system permease protein
LEPTHVIQILYIIPLFFVPLFVDAEFVLTIFTFSFLLATMAIGLNLNFGFSGQLNMFTAASFGISAYVTYLSTQHLGVSFWVGLALAGVIITVLSVMIGYLCLRFGLRDFYFALITMAFSELARLVILNWTSMTNGAIGLLVLDEIPVSVPGLAQFTIQGATTWYYVSLGIMAGALIICTVLVRSWIGRCFAAIRLNEDLAQTLGINIFRYKLLAFIIADLFAAVAGAFFGYYSTFIDPQYLSITQGLDSLTMVLLGGAGTLLGPVVGALILGGLPHLIEISAAFRVMLLGAIMILVILAMPKGIVGTLIHIQRRSSNNAS